ncbi:hypothetical protein MVEN_02326700 [Mycena venus]|uniref:C2H2-type domain-containing protein n=1 Tax=Mycena venus TaxID=2733690 RepID=A0A8H6X3R8_9AGAR|nr:hypothetical protein MVEN_02326700 [Mycena venus]
MSPTFPCEYCSARLSTLQGLRSHVRQSLACTQKQNDDGLSSDESDTAESPPQQGADGGAMDLDRPEMDGAGDFVEEDNTDQNADPPHDAPSPEARALPGGTSPGKRPRATVEEVADEDERWEQDFPEDLAAGDILDECKTQFEKLQHKQKTAGRQPWHPFESEDEWELARWLMTSGLSQSKIDEHLKLKVVREGINPSFHNSRAFLKYIDALPEGPKWFCHPFELTGDELDADKKPKTQIVEMWYRDPVECVKELLGNPAFTKQGYKPQRIFKNADGTNREYNEMWTGEWWWKIQQLLPKRSTLCPIIISSDKTQLTRFSGDQQAWPVYLTIGNIDKETRRSPSSHATVLLGYIPVTKLEIFVKARRSEIAHQLFHDCMRVMLQPLKMAGKDGLRMDCADGFVRKMFLILAAYIADYPEQCLICCCRENSCPRCLVDPKQRGDLVDSPFRDPIDTQRILSEESQNKYPPEFLTQNLRPINPFWVDFPHCDIFSCMTPDLLHELHNGVFGDHIVSWSSEAMVGLGPEIDLRFRAMAPHPTLRHFKKGISLTSQWTGAEHKNMEKVFLGVLANATEPRVQCAVRGLIDFIYYAHFETHCDESLSKMDEAWASFHINKEVYKDLEIREHFDINKLHKLKHYTDSIRSRGTADGFNTENTERLHIDLAKVGYKATNKKAYIQQMTVWLRRQEAVHKFRLYLQWAVPDYIPKPSSNANADEDGDGDRAHVPDPDVEDEGDLEVPQNSEPSIPVYAVAKIPGFPSVSVPSLSTDFHAPDFLYHLGNFLQSKSILSAMEPSDTSTFPVYKRLSLALPVVSEVTSHVVLDKIRAVKGEPMKMTPKGVIPAKAGQFDTILVHTPLRPQDEGPTSGLCVARVRVIFRLPEQYGAYPDPLAYIDWYRPLTRPVANLGMHQVSLSSRNHRQKSEIIPVTEIFRSCHLIPVFGRSIDPTWTAECVLDQCKSFYLNPYLRHHDFYLLRYLVDLYDSRKAEKERRVRRKLLGRAGR